MKVLHWCMLGVTIVLLVCEVTISQLCKSTIILVDGFHTLFILMRMALLPTQPAGNIELLPYLASPHPASNLPVESSIKLPPSTQAATNGSPASDQLPVTQATHEAASQLNSHQLFSPTSSPPALNCGISYTDSRIQPAGAFMSSLVLGSLSISYLIEVTSFILEPHPVQQPLLLVVVGAVSLLCKTLMLWLNWGQLQEDRAEAGGQKETESHVEVNHKVLAAEETIGLPEQGQVLGDASQAQSVVDNLHHNGALVLCNPGASKVPDSDSKSLEQQQPEVHLHAETPQERLDSEETSGEADLKVCKCDSPIKDTPETSTDKGHPDNNSQNASEISSVFKSPHHTESPVRSSRLSVSMLSFILVVQGLLSALLALINSLVMLLVNPQCKHSSGACSLLVYLDPGLSLLAVITLITVAAPQVHRYGLLLLQATPPHICVSDVGERIARVPGVRAVHDLHVWQLTKSLTVASVHVHCHAGFPAHRYADLMLGVTKVLQSVGVSCCTVQPEFALGSRCSAGSVGDPSPVVSREDLSLACSLSCGKTCAGYMCCSLLEEETKSVAAPPAGKTKEEPHTLIIENTFL